MKRITGWTLVAVIAVSLLAAPVASARPVASEAQHSITGWTQVALDWLTRLIPGAPGDAGAGMTSIGAADGNGSTIDPNGHGLLPMKPQPADGDQDNGSTIDPNG